MNDAAALLKAILANPDDDALRLVYADCIEEAGDGERAEFIRDQVGDAHGGQYTAHVGTCRIHRSYAGIPPQWYGDWGVQVHRGFVRWLSLPANDWLAHNAAILALHPVLHVALTTCMWFMVSNGKYALYERSPSVIPLMRWCDKFSPPGLGSLVTLEDILEAEWQGITFDNLPSIADVISGEVDADDFL